MLRFFNNLFLFFCIISIWQTAALASKPAIEDVSQNAKQIFVLVNKENNVTAEFIQTLSSNKRISFEKIHADVFRQGDYCDSPDCLYIALGHRALDKAILHLKDAHVLSVLTSSVTFKDKFQERPATISAIYAEPSLDHQVALIKNIFRKDFKIGVLYSEKSTNSLNDIKALQKKYQFGLVSTLVENQNNLKRHLDTIASADVLLAIPDNTIYNKYNFKQIILTTYANNQPIIGFSRNFVKSGALASSFSSIKHIAEEAALNITYFSISGELLEPYYADKYGISVNDQISRSLGITVRSEDFPSNDIERIKGTRYVER